MKTKKDFTKWVEQQIDFYKPILGIPLIDFSVVYGTDGYLSISCCYPYVRPKIFYSEEAFEDWKNNDLPKVKILHEMLHFLTDPLYVKSNARYVSEDEVLNERERLTDTLSVIINNLVERNEKNNKKPARSAKRNS